jgi:ankyrin repeat protein
MKRYLTPKFTEVKDKALASPEIIVDWLCTSIKVKDTTVVNLMPHLPVMSQILNTPAQAILLFNVLKEIATNDENHKFFESVITKTDNIFVNFSLPKGEDNLLHVASAYGSNKITKFLLEKGAEVNAIGTAGETALHKAINHKEEEVVNLLLGAKADPNMTTEGTRYTTLHFARMTDQNAIALKLLKAGANPKIKSTAGHTASELIVLVRKGECAYNLPPLCKITYNDVAFKKGVANFYKGFLNDKNQENYLIESINNFKTSLKTASSEVDKKVILTNLITLNNSLEYEGSTKLFEDIEKSAKGSDFIEILAGLYSSYPVKKLAPYYNCVQSLKILDKAQELINAYPSSISYEFKKATYYNYGISYEYLNAEKSLEYFNLAEQLECNANTPPDQEIIISKFLVYCQQENLDFAKKEVEKVADPSIKKSLINMINTNVEPDIELRKPEALESTITKTIDNTTKIYKYGAQQDYETALALSLESLQTSNECNYLLDIARVIHFYRLLNKCSESLDLIKKSYAEHPEIMEQHTLPFARYQESLVYMQNSDLDRAFKNVLKLQEIASFGKIASYYYAETTTCFIALLLESNNVEEKINHYLSKLFSKDLASKIIETLTKDHTTTISTTPKSEEVEEKEETYMDWVASQPIDLMDALTECDPYKIHTYYQKKKQDIFQRQDYNIKSFKTSWYIGCKYYNDSNVSSIAGKPHFYSLIAEKVAKKLEKAILEECSNALTEVVKGHGEGQIGNRFIKNKLVELKINGGIRLYTKDFYKNDKGDYLIIYDYAEKHDNMSKIINSSHIEVHNVPCCCDEIYAISLVGEEGTGSVF